MYKSLTALRTEKTNKPTTKTTKTTTKKQPTNKVVFFKLQYLFFTKKKYSKFLFHGSVYFNNRTGSVNNADM